MNLGLSDRHALVVGATSGLGLAIAQELDREGAKVSLGGRSIEAARERTSDMARATPIQLDLNDTMGLSNAVRNAIEASGPIDILVLNSGGPPVGKAADIGPESVELAARAMLLAQIQLVSEILPGMRERRWGRILAIGSSGIREPISGLALSNTVRAALAGYLKTLASEVAGDGVNINMILPGRIHTQRIEQLDAKRADAQNRTVDEVRAESESRIPMGRYGRPEEFGTVGAFLCSEAASYVTGSQIRVDGGMSAGY